MHASPIDDDGSSLVQELTEFIENNAAKVLTTMMMS